MDLGINYLDIERPMRKLKKHRRNDPGFYYLRPK